MDRVDLDEQLTVVVIDDHGVARRGIESLFRESSPPIDVVASGATIDVALDEGARADVVVLDLQLLPGKPNLDGLQRLVNARRKVVVYTQFAADSEIALSCADLGAYAYVTKVEAEEHLVEAVRAAATGFPYTPPTLGGAIAGDTDPRRSILSLQEITALRMWFTSRSKDMAAEAMGVAPSTIRTYIDRARTKYAAQGRPASTKTDMVRRAVEDGLIELDDFGKSEGHEPP